MKLEAPLYCVEEDSDEYGAISSDDEGDEGLRDEQMIRDELLTDKQDAGDESDEFEKEMNAEIRASMSVNLPDKDSNKKQKTEPAQFYDDIYFNSSDEDESGKKGKVDKRVKSNDELFYDPKQDDKDEKWIMNKRRNYLTPGSRKKDGESSKKEEETPATSATLCCPACMTVLCRDCQQHETFVSQFRAMFVFNCLVLTGETLSYKVKEKRRRRKEEEKEELYNPVKCAVCQTKVGVFDKEEVYHFFNVLAT